MLSKTQITHKTKNGGLILISRLKARVRCKNAKVARGLNGQRLNGQNGLTLRKSRNGYLRITHAPMQVHNILDPFISADEHCL